ncbi:hypothetical protein VTN31DRAFT_2377 [Thermomyces dupontii]|uniref:uncharacterized protein n=1 Tax=Talaromyces thermophilus TaxID=28565 RepID=UPI00374413BA
MIRELGTDGGGKCDLEIDEETNEFRHAFIFPYACLKAVDFCKGFFSLDACHLKGSTYGIGLCICTVDGENQVLPMVYGVAAGTETKDIWVKLLTFFRDTINDFYKDDADGTPAEVCIRTLVSDRGKGLVPACQEVLPWAHHYHCIQHVAVNIGQQFGADAERLFRRMPTERSEVRLNAAIDEVRQIIGHAAAEYIEKL